MHTAAADFKPQGPTPGLPLAQWHALDQAVGLAEFDAQGRMLHANAIYLQMLGLPQDEVPGRLHRNLCIPAWAESPSYDAFWAQLLAGQAQSGVVEHQRADGQRCWLEAMYTPVFDAQGEIVCCMTTVTDLGRLNSPEDRDALFREAKRVNQSTGGQVWEG